MIRGKCVHGIAMIMLLAMLAGCGQEQEYATVSADIADTFPLEAEPVEDNPQFAQSDGPYAIIHTTAGDIKILLYPEQAPLAVENFIGLAKSGYYDNSLFHYVVGDNLIQAGLPEGAIVDEDSEEEEVLEESLWGTAFSDEFSDELHNFPGALCMANSGFGTNTSQFYFVVNEDIPEDERLISSNMCINETLLAATIEGSALNDESPMTEEEQQEYQDAINEKLQSISTDGVPEEELARYQEAVDRYMEIGGNYWLDYSHTVFGQIVDGLNIAQAISQVKIDTNRQPKQDILIVSIEIIE